MRRKECHKDIPRTFPVDKERMQRGITLGVLVGNLLNIII